MRPLRMLVVALPQPVAQHRGRANGSYRSSRLPKLLSSAGRNRSPSANRGATVIAIAVETWRLRSNYVLQTTPLQILSRLPDALGADNLPVLQKSFKRE
jgi:hypothetical protein